MNEEGGVYSNYRFRLLILLFHFKVNKVNSQLTANAACLRVLSVCIVPVDWNPVITSTGVSGVCMTQVITTTRCMTHLSAPLETHK